jgi:hypothetical protein
MRPGGLPHDRAGKARRSLLALYRTLSVARLELKLVLEGHVVMKLMLAIAAVVLVCSACVQGGSGPSSADSSGITMYGTIDEGISYHK